MDRDRPITVTLGIIAYNEEEFLPALLEDVRRQTYPHKQIEVILADSGSDDRTKVVMEAFRKENKTDFLRIELLDNPERIQAAGWNKVIRAATCDMVIRVDAHSTIREDFVEKNIDCIGSGEYVCGGHMVFLTANHSPYGRMLLDAEMSSFGSSPAEYRHDSDGKKSVRSVFNAAYRREIFDRVGLFNEELVRTEDNELHWRITSAGYRICFDPEIHSGHYIRGSLKDMLRQKYLNGYWIGRTLYICPGCISAFHLVPLLFVISLLAGMAMAASGLPLLISVIMMTYGAVMAANALWCIVRTHNIADILLPVICLMIHISYGIGTAAGLLAGRWRKCTAKT